MSLTAQTHTWNDLMNTLYEVLKKLNIKLKNEIIIFNKIDMATDPVLTKHDCKSVSPILFQPIKMKASKK